MLKKMNDTILERFKKIVAARIGLHIGKEDSEAFHKAGTMLMKSLNIDDPERYLSFLESDTAESKQEWKTLIRSITTGESYFFRDKGHFFLLQNTILPELIRIKGPERSLRIWSAGCATGEEPYSVAILLDMLLPDLKGWDISIIGTDINEESLKKAARGIYSEWSFRMVDKAVQSKYFQRHHNEWEIHANIKKMVKFQYGNLIDADFFSQNTEIRNMDIILCRNVFIYFGKEAVSSALNSFQKILNDGGYLVTGHSELYGHEFANLRGIMFPEAVIYKKIADYGMRSAESASAEFGMRSAKSSNAKISSKLRTPNTTLADSALRTSETPDPTREVEELVKKRRYPEAIDKAESYLTTYKDNYDLLYLIAQAYANSGDYDRAAITCRSAMTINADSAAPYFLLAQVTEARGDDELAKDLLKKAIYLDPAFIAAYCELGGLYEKEQDAMRAEKARTTAIEFLKLLPSQAQVKPYDITAGELLSRVEYLTRSNRAGLMPAVHGANGR